LPGGYFSQTAIIAGNTAGAAKSYKKNKINQLSVWNIAGETIFHCTGTLLFLLQPPLHFTGIFDSDTSVEEAEEL
jgi:hypothetical protein